MKFVFDLQLHAGAATARLRRTRRRDAIAKAAAAQAAAKSQASQAQAEQAKQEAATEEIGRAAAQQARQTLGEDVYSGGGGTFDNAIMRRDALRRRVRGVVATKQLLGG